jgi:hypothetical protein
MGITGFSGSQKLKLAVRPVAVRMAAEDHIATSLDGNRAKIRHRLRVLTEYFAVLRKTRPPPEHRQVLLVAILDGDEHRGIAGRMPRDQVELERRFAERQFHLVVTLHISLRLRISRVFRLFQQIPVNCCQICLDARDVILQKLGATSVIPMPMAKKDDFHVLLRIESKLLEAIPNLVLNSVGGKRIQKDDPFRSRDRPRTFSFRANEVEVVENLDRERLCLMWVGAGLWHDTDFYTAFEEEFGAVFVWSMYLAFGPDGYIRYGLDDPLMALASRTVSMNEQLHNPPWANEWIVDQAKKHRIDAALVLTPLGTRPAATGNRFIERALEEAGIPVLPVVADMVDARGWDPQAMRRKVSEFFTLRVLTKSHPK